MTILRRDGWLIVGCYAETESREQGSQIRTGSWSQKVAGFQGLGCWYHATLSTASWLGSVGKGRSGHKKTTRDTGAEEVEVMLTQFPCSQQGPLWKKSWCRETSKDDVLSICSSEIQRYAKLSPHGPVVSIKPRFSRKSPFSQTQNAGYPMSRQKTIYIARLLCFQALFPPPSP